MQIEYQLLTSAMDSKEIKPVNPKSELTLNAHWKDWCKSWSSSTLATSCEASTHWKRPWRWERIRQKENGAAEDEVVRQHHRLNDMNFSQFQAIVKDKGAWHAAIHGVAKSQTRLSDRTTTMKILFLFLFLFYFFNNEDFKAQWYNREGVNKEEGNHTTWLNQDYCPGLVVIEPLSLVK